MNVVHITKCILVIAVTATVVLQVVSSNVITQLELKEILDLLVD